MSRVNWWLEYCFGGESEFGEKGKGKRERVMNVVPLMECHISDGDRENN